MKPVTMAQVAEKAGVHVTTVSLALRNHPSLPERTRDRIRKLAEEMGYRPDPNLRALMAYRRSQQQTRTIQTLAYVTNWDSRWGWQDFPAHGLFFVGAQQRSEALGYRLEHFWLGEPKLSERRLGEILHSRGISGVVLASQRFDSDARLDMEWSRFASVKIDYFPHEPRLHMVTNDQRSILRLATRKVRAAGYRRIGLALHRDWDRGVDGSMSSGHIEAQQEYPLEDRVPIHFIEKVDSPPADERWGGRAPLSRLAEWVREWRPDAVIGFGPALRPQLEALGLRVPQDIGFADLFLGAEDGSVAGIRHNCRRVGEVAVELLAGQLQLNTFGLPEYPTSTLVEGTWFEGETLPRR